MDVLRHVTVTWLFIAASGAALAVASSGRAASPEQASDLRFIPATPGLRAKCKATARAVGYAVPCPMRVPAGLVASGGRPGCEIDIIGPGMRCPNTVLSWRGWVVGSSTAGDEHLVLTASPHALTNDAKVVNGPAWYPEARVRALHWVNVNGRRMRKAYVPPQTNDGSAFSGHVVLIWTISGHTYAIGFHDIHGARRTLELDVKLARSISLVHP